MTSVLDRTDALLGAAGLRARSTAATAEAAGRLDESVLARLHEAGLFRLMLAPEEGGRDYSLAECFPVFESLARAEGALGWIAAIGCTAVGLVGRRITNADTAKQVLGHPALFVAGGANPMTLRADVVDGGYRVNGRLGFASGSAHATHFVAGAAMFSGHSMVESPAGGPVLVGLLVAPDDVTVLDTWHVAGLGATSSRDLVFDNVFVPASHSFSMAGPAPKPNPRDATESLPLLTRLGPGLAHVCLGIATHALDVLRDVAATHNSFGAPAPVNERPDVQIDAARAYALVDSGRAYLTEAWNTLSAALLAGTMEFDDLARVRLACVTAAENAVRATELAFSAAGSAAIYRSGDLERCWRDVHVAQHHVMVSARHLQRVGKVLLGLPAGPGPL